MEAMKKRICPDCVRGRGPKTVDRITGEVCGRCRGIGDIESLGACQGPVFDDTPGGDGKKVPCPFPADVDHGAQLLCDGHALGRAVELGGPCPSCGGDPSRGMHRGEVIGVGKVMRCAGSQHERDLQRLSDAASGVQWEDLDEDDPGAECLTDSERNPSMGGPVDDRSW